MATLPPNHAGKTPATTSPAGTEVVEPSDANGVARTWVIVAAWLAAGCALLWLSISLPRMWASQTPPLADHAGSFVALGWVTLAAVCLPAWADRWTLSAGLALSGVVFVLLALLIEGTGVRDHVRTFAWMSGSIAAFSTIWVIASKRTALRPSAWLLCLTWVLGWPTWRFLQGN